MKKLDQAVKDVDYYRQVCVCMWSVLFHNMDPCSLRRLKISGQDTMTWSWRSRDWTRRWSVSAGELANSMNETFELSSLFHSDFLMKIERRCRSYGDSTRTSSVWRFVLNVQHFMMSNISFCFTREARVSR